MAHRSPAASRCLPLPSCYRLTISRSCVLLPHFCRSSCVAAQFCAAVGPVYDYSHMALRRAFDVFDTDHNGSIERTELKTMLTKLKLLPVDADSTVFEKIWSLADTNRDGRSRRTGLSNGCCTPKHTRPCCHPDCNECCFAS